MPFSPISLSGNRTFSQRRPGQYVLDGLTYGDPQATITVNPGSRSKDRKTVNATLTRSSQKARVDGTIATASVSTTITVPSDPAFTASEIDALLSDLNEFTTPGVLGRILQGEQ